MYMYKVPCYVLTVMVMNMWVHYQALTSAQAATVYSSLLTYMPFIKKLLKFPTATDHIDVQPAMLYKNS